MRCRRPRSARFLDQVVEVTGAATPAGDEVAEELVEPEDPRVLAAEEATARGDYDDAVGQYAAILAAAPAHARAAAAIREVELLRRVSTVAPDAVAKADAAPGDVDLALAAADLQLAEGQVSNAFARLLAAIRASSGAERERGPAPAGRAVQRRRQRRPAGHRGPQGALPRSVLSPAQGAPRQPSAGSRSPARRPDRSSARSWGRPPPTAAGYLQLLASLKPSRNACTRSNRWSAGTGEVRRAGRVEQRPDRLVQVAGRQPQPLLVGLGERVRAYPPVAQIADSSADSLSVAGDSPRRCRTAWPYAMPTIEIARSRLGLLVDLGSAAVS